MAEQTGEGIFLTYKDVKEANPKWSDKMIEDYLSIKRDLESGVDDLTYIEDRLDAVESRLDAAEDRLDTTEGRLDAAEGRLDTAEDRLDAVESRLDAIELLMPSYIYTLVSHAVLLNEIITCNNTSDIEVLLPLSPFNGQAVSVKRSNAKVVINGNGKNIDGNSTVTMNVRYVGLDLTYSTDAGFWSLI